MPATQPLVPVHFVDYGDESDPGPYPVPLDARVEGGANADGDRHVLALQQGTCRLYELFNARRVGAGWDASSGAVFDLGSNRCGPTPGRRRTPRACRSCPAWCAATRCWPARSATPCG